MHNPILLTAICAVVSFFIGAIPFGLILGRVFNHTDIRKAGSGNIGTTNALRVAGPKVAALTLLLDCLKGAICVLIARPLIASVGYGFPVSIMLPVPPATGCSASFAWQRCGDTSSRPTSTSVAARASPWGWASYSPGTGPSDFRCWACLSWPSPSPSMCRWLACRGHRSSHCRLRGLSVQQPGPQVLYGDDRHHRGVGPSREHQ